MKNINFLTLSLLSLCVLSTNMVASKAKANDVSQLALLKCTKFENASKRLNCFESLIQKMPMMRSADDTDDAEEEKGFLFGLGMSKKTEKKKEATDAETYFATVTKVEEGNYRKLYFYTEEGHVWRQIEGKRFWYPRKESFKIEINRGRMGNYQLKIDGKGEFTSVRRLK